MPIVEGRNVDPMATEALRGTERRRGESMNFAQAQMMLRDRREQREFQGEQGEQERALKAKQGRREALTAKDITRTRERGATERTQIQAETEKTNVRETNELQEILGRLQASTSLKLKNITKKMQEATFTHDTKKYEYLMGEAHDMMRRRMKIQMLGRNMGLLAALTMAKLNRKNSAVIERERKRNREFEQNKKKRAERRKDPRKSGLRQIDFKAVSKAHGYAKVLKARMDDIREGVSKRKEDMGMGVSGKIMESPFGWLVPPSGASKVGWEAGKATMGEMGWLPRKAEPQEVAFRAVVDELQEAYPQFRDNFFDTDDYIMDGTGEKPSLKDLNRWGGTLEAIGEVAGEQIETVGADTGEGEAWQSVQVAAMTRLARLGDLEVKGTPGQGRWVSPSLTSDLTFEDVRREYWERQNPGIPWDEDAPDSVGNIVSGMVSEGGKDIVETASLVDPDMAEVVQNLLGVAAETTEQQMSAVGW